MDSTAIKLEPGTSTEESVAVILTEIDIEYPFIKKECPETILQNNSGSVHVDTVSSNAASGPREEYGKRIPRTEIDLDLLDVKKENTEHSERITERAGSINAETATIKVEPGTQEEVKGRLPYTEIEFGCMDVKKECLERSGKITQTADMFLKTPPEKKQHSCSQCNYSCSRKSMLELHLRTHTGEKPFSCPECNYSCNSKGNLKRHMFSHSGEKSFACTNCNYSCSTKAQLKSHMLTHSEEKPFSCTECNYSSSSKRNLKSHKFTHGGKKPFSCSDCNFSCFSMGHLKIHMFRHSGEKPFSCTSCNYSCSTKGNLKRHMFSHVEEKPFTCPDCNHSSSTKEHLKRHMFTHSGGKL